MVQLEMDEERKMNEERRQAAQEVQRQPRVGGINAPFQAQRQLDLDGIQIQFDGSNMDFSGVDHPAQMAGLLRVILHANRLRGLASEARSEVQLPLTEAQIEEKVLDIYLIKTNPLQYTEEEQA